ncbi:hypothetical protein BLNAU_4085 [Blattamonas nauphoetae]|uniref:Uncharacterized protein n=1 Tax=Blattamonas nauphoetae TaxID=2049346 RepID=A0ABQ9YBE4_9EUKA|nr:hypothetical protein BLNAU_4085 [Blattamonas nauphoetae]
MEVKRQEEANLAILKEMQNLALTLEKLKQKDENIPKKDTKKEITRTDSLKKPKKRTQSRKSSPSKKLQTKKLSPQRQQPHDDSSESERNLLAKLQQLKEEKEMIEKLYASQQTEMIRQREARLDGQALWVRREEEKLIELEKKQAEAEAIRKEKEKQRKREKEERKRREAAAIEKERQKEKERKLERLRKEEAEERRRMKEIEDAVFGGGSRWRLREEERRMEEEKRAEEEERRREETRREEKQRKEEERRKEEEKAKEAERRREAEKEQEEKILQNREQTNQPKLCDSCRQARHYPFDPIHSPQHSPAQPIRLPSTHLHHIISPSSHPSPLNRPERDTDWDYQQPDSDRFRRGQFEPEIQVSMALPVPLSQFQHLQQRDGFPFPSLPMQESHALTTPRPHPETHPSPFPFQPSPAFDSHNSLQTPSAYPQSAPSPLYSRNGRPPQQYAFQDNPPYNMVSRDWDQGDHGMADTEFYSSPFPPPSGVRIQGKIGRHHPQYE